MATSTIRKPIPYTFFTAVGPGKSLKIKTSATSTFGGITLFLFRSTSNGGSLISPLCYGGFYGNRPAYMTLTPVAGNIPSDLTITAEGGVVVTNANNTYTASMIVTVLEDFDGVLSFEVV